MLPSPSSTEPQPIIRIIRGILERLERKSMLSQLGRRDLVLFASTIRSQLDKIYGKNAPETSAFPREIAPGGSVDAELAIRMAHVKRMLEALEGVPNATATALSG